MYLSAHRVNYCMGCKWCYGGHCYWNPNRIIPSSKFAEFPVATKRYKNVRIGLIYDHAIVLYAYKVNEKTGAIVPYVYKVDEETGAIVPYVYKVNEKTGAIVPYV